MGAFEAITGPSRRTWGKFTLPPGPSVIGLVFFRHLSSPAFILRRLLLFWGFLVGGVGFSSPRVTYLLVSLVAVTIYSNLNPLKTTDEAAAALWALLTLAWLHPRHTTGDALLFGQACWLGGGFVDAVVAGGGYGVGCWIPDGWGVRDP